MSLEAEAAKVRNSLSLYSSCAVLLIFALIGSVVAWSLLTSIEGAVVATGKVITEGKSKVIQHPDGGVVEALQVEDGQRVEFDDVLIRLDGNSIKSELQAIRKRLFDLRLRKIRLGAEVGGLDVKKLEALFMQAVDNRQVKDFEALIKTQIALHQSRSDSYESRLEKLKKRISSLEVELRGSRELISAKKDELKLINHELEILSALEAKSLVSMSRIAPLRRERARIRGELARHRERAAKIPEQLSEADAEVSEVRAQRMADTLKELQEADGEIRQNVEREAILTDKISRLVIRAPASGYVHELRAHTTGGVVQAGETIASIVPDSAELSIDARVAVNDRDNVAPGMPARIRFTAFNLRSTPEIEGRVRWLSPDISVDEGAGHQYFEARIDFAASGPGADLLPKLSPGMMAEILVTTQPRNVASYFVKPIVDQFVRAFREE